MRTKSLVREHTIRCEVCMSELRALLILFIFFPMSDFPPQSKNMHLHWQVHYYHSSLCTLFLHNFIITTIWHIPLHVWGFIYECYIKHCVIPKLNRVIHFCTDSSVDWVKPITPWADGFLAESTELTQPCVIKNVCFCQTYLIFFCIWYKGVITKVALINSYGHDL